MKHEEIYTGELVVKTLSLLPLMTKKLFEPVQFLHDSDLHTTHFCILHIVESTGAIPTTEIAKKLAIKKSNLTPLITKLENEKLITRRKDSRDRRIIFIELTKEGIVFLKEKKEILQEEVKEKLEKLTIEEQLLMQEAIMNLEWILSKLNK